MANIRKFPIFAGIVALTIGSLSACGGTPTDDSPSSLVALPSSTSTSTPTPTPTEEAPQVSTIIVDGDSVYTTISEGGIGVDIPFTTDPTTAAGLLSAAIGLDATISTTPDAACGGGLNAATWGGITFYSPYASAPPGALFYAQVNAKTTTNGITVTIPSGQWVSYDGSDTIAANAAAPLIDYGPALQVLAYDVEAGTTDSGPDDFWGASAIVRDDAIESFASPIHYYYDC